MSDRVVEVRQRMMADAWLTLCTLGTSLLKLRDAQLYRAWASLTPHQAGYTSWKGTHRMREDWPASPTKPHRVAGSSLSPKDLDSAMS